MSDQPMKAEYVDRIDRLTELAEAEREVQAASTKFEQAQWEVVKAAEHLQEWTNVWKYRRESVLSRFPDTLTPEQITFYGQGNRLSEANEVLRQFCASVEAKNKQLSALTSPLQHKGGETEAGDKLGEFMKLDGAVKWEGGECPVAASTLVEVILRNHEREIFGQISNLAHRFDWTHDQGHDDIIAYRIISSSEVDSGPRSEAPAGDARIEQTISTLQASSGEGETTVSELGAADVDGVDAQTAGATLPDGGQESPDLLQESRCSVAGCEIHGTPPIDATEPAAYSPVNNADEPVTKPEADFFAQAIIPVQSGIEFSVDGGPKQATGAAKLFGGLGIFGKKIDA